MFGVAKYSAPDDVGGELEAEDEYEEEEDEEMEIKPDDAGEIGDDDLDDVEAWTPNVDENGDLIDSSYGRSEITVALARRREKAKKQNPNGRVAGRKLVPWHRE